MSCFLNLCLAAAIQTIPCEYVIDFGAEPVPFTYEMTLTLEARDGTQYDFMIEWSGKTDPKANRDDTVQLLRRDGWATRPGPGNSLIVTGLAKGNKSPIKSVTLKSDKVIPIQVRWVPLLPEKKKK